MANFYDEFAPLYQLIFQDWDASMARQGEQLRFGSLGAGTFSSRTE